MLGQPRGPHWLSTEPLERVFSQPEQASLYLQMNQPVVSNQVLEAVCRQRTQPSLPVPSEARGAHDAVPVSPFAGLDRPVLRALYSASDQPGQPHPGASVAGLNHRSCD